MMNRQRNDKPGLASRQPLPGGEGAGIFSAPRWHASRVLSLTVAGTMVAGLTLVGAGPVAAADYPPPKPSSRAGEIYARPSGSTVVLSGHGFGHGRGMSQWGAYGAATQGKTWRQIMGFYYPGTALTNLGNPRIRVRLDVASSQTLYLPNLGGLRLAGKALPGVIAGADVTRYRVQSRPDGGLQVDAHTSSGWQLLQVSTTDAAFTNSARGNVVDVLLPSKGQRAYRGSIVVSRTSPTSIMTISSLPMESYLRAVVPAEMPASWHVNAVRAQSVAARSYANFDLARTPAGRNWDTCDTTSCQMYSGVPAEHALSNAALAATAGQALTYKGKATFTQFSAANGGYSTAGSQPYLVAKADPYDGVMRNTASSWNRDVTAASIQARWPSIGTYRQLRIISRDRKGRWGGRVLTAAVDGSKGTVFVSGATIRFAFGLKSEWFIPTNSTALVPSPGKAPAKSPTPTSVGPVAAKPAVSATRTAYTPYKKAVLRQGSKGSAVVMLQRALRVKADGAFGTKTRTTLVAFQKKQRIKANGIASRVVWDRLEKRAHPLIGYRSYKLRQGSKGSAVKVLQRALRVPANGVFGARTVSAVKAVQKRAKLSRTGVVAGITWVAIENRMKH